jgi:ABC-type dipeptide/oligopeptide/nickel transport system permease subunit
MFGAQASLFIGVGSVVLAFMIALPMGVIAGYQGGRTDFLLMRFVDIGLTFPTIFLALLLVTILGTGLQSLVLALAISSIFPYARLSRSAVLAVRSQDFIVAARSTGCTDLRIMVRHLLPNSLSPIIIHSTFEYPRVILAGAGLSFLGLGVQKPLPEWGAMIADAKSYMTIAPHLALAPGLALMIVVVGFNLFGDGLRDLLDPKMRKL